MTNDKDMTSTRALVAIDIAKLKHDVVIEPPGMQRRKRMKVLNTQVEHQRFIAQLQALNCPVQIGFEATGNYHRPLVWRLLAAGFDLRLISSVQLNVLVRLRPEPVSATF